VLLVRQPCSCYITPSWSLRQDLHPHWSVPKTDASSGWATQGRVGSAGFAPAVSCSRSTRVGCYATTRSPSSRGSRIASSVGLHARICTLTTRSEASHAVCYITRRWVRQPGFAPGRPVWKTGMLSVEHHWRRLKRVEKVPARGNAPRSFGYQPIALLLSYAGLLVDGRSGRTCTCDIRLMRPAFSLTELRSAGVHRMMGPCGRICTRTGHVLNVMPLLVGLRRVVLLRVRHLMSPLGRAGRICTCGLLPPRQARWLLRYSPRR
jgi:hypothetical protein